MQALKSFVTSKKVLEKHDIVAKARFELAPHVIFGLEVKCSANWAKPYAGLMAVLAYTSTFSALVWMTKRPWILLKTYLVVPEDLAFILSKCGFNPFRNS